MADKHNIPKGKMHSNCRLLPDHIVCKSTQRNNIRGENTCDPALNLLNEEITSDTYKDIKPMEGTLRCTLRSQAQHTHSLEDNTWYIQQSTSTQTYCKLFHQTIHKHATHKTNISINRATHKIQGYNITLTTTQAPKHIDPLGLAFLTSMLKTALNENIIPGTSHMEVR